MPETNADAEIEALQVVIDALEPLDDDARSRVVEYTLKRLGDREASAGDFRTCDASTEATRYPFSARREAAVVRRGNGRTGRLLPLRGGATR